MKKKLLKPIFITMIGLGLVACTNDTGANTNVVNDVEIEDTVKTKDLNVETEVENKKEDTKVDLEKKEDTKKDTIEVKKENKKDDSHEEKKEEEEKEDYHDRDGRYTSTLITKSKGEPIDYIEQLTYNLKFDEDFLVVSGSLDFAENPEDFDNRENIENKEDHKFKVDENTVFQAVGGLADPKKFTKEEFIKWYEGVKDSGLALIILVEDGIVKSVSISS